jgi:hypothetical protein
MKKDRNDDESGGRNPLTPCPVNTAAEPPGRRLLHPDDERRVRERGIQLHREDRGTQAEACGYNGCGVADWG